MHKPQIGTNWWGPFTVDTLVIPTNGAANVLTTSIDGTIAKRVLSCVYSANTLTLTFKPNTILPNTTFDVSMMQGTSTLVEAQIATVDLDAQTVAIQFQAPGGAGTPPPAANLNAALHVNIFRPLPVK